MPEYDISVVVPTKDRQTDLLRCISSLGDQSTPPHEILVINDGELDESAVDEMRAAVPSTTEFVLTESVGKPGLSTARNTGARQASGDIVLFLDDDVVVGDRYIEHLKELYETHDAPDLAGIGGFDASDRTNTSTSVRWFNKLFAQGGFEWRITRVGIHAQNNNIDTLVDADWLAGYNASYKRDILLEESFVYWNGGREALEDIEFGWRLNKKGYRFKIAPSLEIDHYQSEENRDAKNIGLKLGRNRVRIFRKHGSMSYTPLLLWAGLGEVLKEVLAPLFGNDIHDSLSKALGICQGYATELVNDSR